MLLMPFNPIVGWRRCSHCLRPPLPEKVRHLLIQPDLLQPVLACFACRSVPAVPRNALIPTSPFMTVWSFPDHPTICQSMSRISQPAHIISPCNHSMYNSQKTVTVLSTGVSAAITESSMDLRLSKPNCSTHRWELSRGRAGQLS